MKKLYLNRLGELILLLKVKVIVPLLRSAWAAICTEFNANENVTTRAVQQLQVRHGDYDLYITDVIKFCDIVYIE